MSSARAIDSVVDWLQSLGLAEYAAVFAQHQITPDLLSHLTEADVDRLSLPVGPRRRLLVALEALKAKTREVVPAAPSAPSPLKRDSTAGAERRQLTVMFCDLVGSTALSTRHDPEDLRELIADYHRVVRNTVGRFDGFVAKYMGDGVLIYFG